MEKTAEIKEASYENITVQCAHCQKECIFNRISDLKTTMPITGKNLKCDECGKSFRTTGDLITSAKYRWFLGELPTLLKSKKYGLYISALCQACEAFMHQAIINKLIDRNPDYRDEKGHFCSGNRIGANAYNQVYEDFGNNEIEVITKNNIKDKTKYKNATFSKLLGLFLHTFDEARVNKLPSLKNCKEDRRIESFSVLEKSDIHKTRNNTVHKNAYRPSFREVQKYDHLINVIYWLGLYLNVKDSIYFLNNNRSNGSSNIKSTTLTLKKGDKSSGSKKAQ